MDAIETDVLTIASGYLGRSELQVLRNATTAIAAVGTQEAAALLADLATRHPDASVRLRTIRELENMDEKAKREAAGHALARLLEGRREDAAPNRDHDPETGVEPAGWANELLATLGRQGIPIDLPKAVDTGQRHGLQRWSTPARQLYEDVLGFWKVRRYLAREARRPFGWSLFVAFLTALPGVALTLALLAGLEPGLSGLAFLGIGLPIASIAAVVTATFHQTAVSVDRYCHPRLGAWAELGGVFWQPRGTLARQFALLLVLAAVSALGLGTLKLGFAGLDFTAFEVFAWPLIATSGLMALVAAMRATAVFLLPGLGRLASATASAAVGLGLGALTLLLGFSLFRHAGVAILISEGALLLPPLASAFFFEHLLEGRKPGRGPTRALIWPLVALSIVSIPAVWLTFNPIGPLEAEPHEPTVARWRLALVPVERRFRVAFPQRVRVSIARDPEPDDLVVELWQGQSPIGGFDEGASQTWDLSRGDYRLVVTAGELRARTGKLDFLLREGYATGVGLLARWLLERMGEEIPDCLVGAFTLELELNVPTPDDPEQGTLSRDPPRP